MQTRAEKDAYFMSLVAKPAVKKKRACVSCGRKFVSESSGHRRCCYCTDKFADMGTLAENVFI